MKTKVRIRENNQMMDVDITSIDKPEIGKKIVKKWQKVINNVAEIFNVPAALIMKITEKNMEVFLRSDNDDNPYPPDGKDKLGHGLYCETVIGKKKPLLVKNALDSEIWKDNPDVKLDMISYFGLPISWEDGESFGTICVLDSKTNEYTAKYKKFLHLMQEMIEDDLELLLTNRKLEELAIKDVLTESYNRRYAIEYLENLKSEYERYQRPFSIIMVDLDGFKKINDDHGHQTGDKVLIEFANSVLSSIRKVDVLARMGGDEFLIICRETSEDRIQFVNSKITKKIMKNDFLQKYSLTLSSGTSTYKDDMDIDHLLHSADQKMYAEKEKI